MARVIIELTDIQDDNGVDRILTGVRLEPPIKGHPTKAQSWGLALGAMVHRDSCNATADKPQSDGEE